MYSCSSSGVFLRRCFAGGAAVSSLRTGLVDTRGLGAGVTFTGAASASFIVSRLETASDDLAFALDAAVTSD